MLNSKESKIVAAVAAGAVVLSAVGFYLWKSKHNDDQKVKEDVKEENK